jgi:hypothetical protein
MYLWVFDRVTPRFLGSFFFKHTAEDKISYIYIYIEINIYIKSFIYNPERDASLSRVLSSADTLGVCITCNTVTVSYMCDI